MSLRVSPAGWVDATIGDVIKPVAGIDPGTAPHALIDYIDIGSIDSERGVVAAPKSILGIDAPSRARQAVREGDVLFSTVRPYLRAIASVPRLRSPVASTGFCVLRPAIGVDRRYLLHWVRSTEFIDGVLPLQRGSSYPAVRDADVHAQPLPLPPTTEQQRIADRLDELLGEIDRAAVELAEAKRKVALYRQSLLKSAIEGKLTAEWRSDFTQVDAATSAASPEGWAEIPNCWRWSTAEAECGFITKGTTPPKSLTSDGAKCVPFLRVTNLTHDGLLNFSDQVFVAEDVHRKFLARSIVKPGDVLMNIVGPPLGQVSMVPSTFPEWNVNQAIAIFRVRPGLLNEFLAYVLLSPGAGRWLQARAKTTAGQTNLTLEVCRGLPVPVPPPAEQAKIVRILNQQLGSLTEQGQAIDRALAMASAQRQNILRAAFSGQLVPQYPNDEPASVLLERIRAQRQTAVPSTKRKPGRTAKATA